MASKPNGSSRDYTVNSLVIASSEPFGRVGCRSAVSHAGQDIDNELLEEVGLAASHSVEQLFCQRGVLSWQRIG